MIRLSRNARAAHRGIEPWIGKVELREREDGREEGGKEGRREGEWALNLRDLAQRALTKIGTTIVGGA